MKRITVVSIVSILFLCLSSLVGYFLRYLNTDSAWLMLGIGVGIGIISFSCAGTLKKYKITNYLCLVLSSIALGFMIRAWYIYRGFDNKWWVMILTSISCAIYLWIYYLLLHIPYFKNHSAGFTIIFIIVSLIAYLFVMGFTKTTFVSTFGYYMIIEIGFIFALIKDSDSNFELLRNMVMSSYAIFIVAFIIFIILLAGDGADFDFDLDLSGIGEGREKKKKKV